MNTEFPVNEETQPALEVVGVIASACGNCVNYSKVSKSRGKCSAHTVCLLDKRSMNNTIKKLTVAKFNYCNQYKITDTQCG